MSGFIVYNNFKLKTAQMFINWKPTPLIEEWRKFIVIQIK